MDTLFHSKEAEKVKSKLDKIYKKLFYTGKKYKRYFNIKRIGTKFMVK